MLGVLILLKVNSICQSRITNDLYFKVAYRPGFVLPEYSLFNYLVDDYVHSYEFTVSKQSIGKSYWPQIYN